MYLSRAFILRLHSQHLRSLVVWTKFIFGCPCISLFKIIFSRCITRFIVPLIPLGCYRESPSAPRVFPVQFLDYTDIDWSTYPNMDHVIQACARAAVARGYNIFSIQFYTQCRWGPSASTDFARSGKSQGCYSGLGAWGTGFVYRVRGGGVGPGEFGATHARTHTHTHTHTRTHTHTYTHARIYARTHLRTYTHTRAHTHAFTRIHARTPLRDRNEKCLVSSHVLPLTSQNGRPLWRHNTISRWFLLLGVFSLNPSKIMLAHPL